MHRYLVIPIRTKYDADGNPTEYVAEIETQSQEPDCERSAAGFGPTPLEAVRNLLNAAGEINSRTVEQYVNEKLGEV